MALYMTDDTGKLIKIAGNILTVSTDDGSAIQTILEGKVDKIEGKNLSSNDYTDSDKTKLLNIEEGANKTIVDEKLSTSSTNPVQNATITSQLNSINNTLTTDINDLKALVDAMLLKVYPVNSIYISVTKTNPQTLFGGTWELLEEGKALWTTTTENTGGQFITAGIPNIQAKLYIGGSGTAATNGTNGALSYGGASDIAGEKGGTGGQDNLVYFNASKGDTGTNTTDGATEFSTNSVYGKSATVQPPAIKIFAWKRIQ